MSKVWETFYLNDTMKNFCESPRQIRMPVGSVVSVMPGKGYKINGRWYRAYPSYIIEENLVSLEDICSFLPGFKLCVGEPLLEKDWRRGWVDEYYPLGKSIFKCIVPGMVRVHLSLENLDMARLACVENKSTPVCPTCTLEQYEDIATRTVFDEVMYNFIYYWLYGRAIGEGRVDDE